MARDPALTALLVGLVVVARSVGGGAESVRQAQHDRVPQRPVRLAMRGDHESNEIVRSPPSATDGVHDALTLLGAQPERGFAGEVDVAVPVLAAEQERLGTAAVAGATFKHDDLLLTTVLVLDPRRTAPPAERYGAPRRLNTTPSRPCALVTAASSAASSTKCAGTIQRPPSRSSSPRSKRGERYGNPRVER